MVTNSNSKTTSARYVALLFAATGALALLAPACGDPQQPTNTDKCASVTCEGGTSCDPTDGVCKCGGEGGLFCAAGETCDADRKLCVSSACAEVTCGGGSTCDVADGKCKCGGSGGPECKAGEQCDAQTRTCVAAKLCEGVICAGGTTCDEADGQCKCGGATCGEFEVCKAGQCTADKCAGVNCTGGTLCDPADGQCKCAGAACGYGQICACTGGGECAAAERSCSGIQRCASVECAGGTTCDPADGKCKCGGPGGPTCGFGQSCDVLAKTCLGGNRCAGVTCTGGLSCDPEDGVCKCGGLNGQVCLAGESCATIDGANRCVTPCDPRAQQCGNGQACDVEVEASLSFCSPAGTKVEGSGCSESKECEPGFHCQKRAGQTGACRRYCDKSDSNGGVCPTVPSAQVCEQLQGAAPGVGACNT